MTDLETIKARLAAATPGPWYVDESLRGVEAQTHGYPVEIVAWTGRADAVLIAHAPGDIAALVAEVEALRAQVQELQALSVSLHKAADAGAQAERAAVVSYLKDLADAAGKRDAFWQGVASGNGYAAQWIERGAHREGKP